MSQDKKNLKLTSVQVDTELFQEFKLRCVRYKFSLHKLVDRAMYSYIKDEDFRRDIHKTNTSK